jgi:hypothetical protein
MQGEQGVRVLGILYASDTEDAPQLGGIDKVIGHGLARSGALVQHDEGVDVNNGREFAHESNYISTLPRRSTLV